MSDKGQCVIRLHPRPLVTDAARNEDMVWPLVGSRDEQSIKVDRSLPLAVLLLKLFELARTS